MSKMSAISYGQRKVGKRCNICGKPIYYGINGAQMLPACLDCYKPSYPCEPTKARQVTDYSELDALEDRCLGDVVD